MHIPTGRFLLVHFTKNKAFMLSLFESMLVHYRKHTVIQSGCNCSHESGGMLFILVFQVEGHQTVHGGVNYMFISSNVYFHYISNDQKEITFM